MIKPTIGRIVWFWESHDAALQPDSQPCAGIVTFVHSDELINITGFSPSGYPMAYSLVPLWQGEGERPHSRHCEWMPYQKGQAAKVETPPMEIFAKVETLLAKVNALEARLVENGKAQSISTALPPLK